MTSLVVHNATKNKTDFSVLRKLDILNIFYLECKNKNILYILALFAMIVHFLTSK